MQVHGPGTVGRAACGGFGNLVWRSLSGTNNAGFLSWQKNLCSKKETQTAIELLQIVHTVQKRALVGNDEI